MGSNLDEEKLGLLLQDSPKPKKGGHRTIPFIIVNESFERLASTGLSPNMVIYLMNDYHMELSTVSVMLSLFSALSNGLAILGAFVADSYLGRFPTIAFGSISSTLGMTIVWLTTMISNLKPPPCDQFNNNSCNSPTAAQLLILFSAFGLNSIGAGCIRPCSMAFGADQLVNKEKSDQFVNKENSNNNNNNQRVLESFINWYNASTAFSAVVALTIVVYIQDNFGWQVGYGVPAMVMCLSALIFLMGSSLYIKVKASKSFLIGLVQVLVVAVKNRNLTLPPLSPSHRDDPSSICYHHQCHIEQKLVAPTENLRCLNKACIIRDPGRDLNPDGSASDPWSLCTLEQVESLKAFLGVVPIWSAGIMLQLAITQNTFTTPQAKTMNRHITSSSAFEIPAGSFATFMVVTIIIWVGFYEGVMVPVLARYTGERRGLSPKVRMGIGLVFSCIGMTTSAIVESMRRGQAIKQGLEDDPNAVVDMSALWLIPQFVLLGIADSFHTSGQTEFFYTQLPKEMSSFAIALLTLEMSASGLVTSLLVTIVDGVTSKGGKVSWLSSNLNKGHVDYYYCLVAILGLINFFYFLFCCRRPGTIRSI